MTKIGDIWDNFPDLGIANGAESIVKLLEEATKDGNHPIAPVAKLQSEQRKQKLNDFKSFHQSQSTALDRGNRNACADRHQMAGIADTQNLNAQRDYRGRITRYTQPARLYGTDKKQTELPDDHPFSASNNESVPRFLRHRSTNYNQLRVVPNLAEYVVGQVEPTQYAQKGKENYNRFMQSHAGKRGTAVGDRAVVFSANGTPHYGDSYLDKSVQENLSANQAAAAAPVSTAASQIKKATPVKASALNRGKNGQVHPKGGAVLTILAGSAAILAITAIMFPLQYLVSFFSFILNLATTASNIRNLSSAITGIFQNIAFLMGFKEDSIKSVEKNFEGIANNIFGKQNVEYVKLQFAKMSVAVTAAVNIVDSIRDGNNALAMVAEENARNTAKIGNALKVARLIDRGFDWMDEKIAYARSRGTLAALNRSLGTTNTVTSELNNITRELKDAVKEEEELEKDYAEAQKRREKDHTKENAPKYTDKDAPKVPNIREEVL